MFGKSLITLGLVKRLGKYNEAFTISKILGSIFEYFLKLILNNQNFEKLQKIPMILNFYFQ